LRQGKGEDWQKAIDTILEEIKGETHQQREGFEEQVGRWIEQGVCLGHQDELWVLSCYRRSLLRKLGKIEDSENKKRENSLRRNVSGEDGICLGQVIIGS